MSADHLRELSDAAEDPICPACNHTASEHGPGVYLVGCHKCRRLRKPWEPLCQKRSDQVRADAEEAKEA